MDNFVVAQRKSDGGLFGPDQSSPGPDSWDRDREVLDSWRLILCLTDVKTANAHPLECKRLIEEGKLAPLEIDDSSELPPPAYSEQQSIDRAREWLESHNFSVDKDESDGTTLARFTLGTQRLKVDLTPWRAYPLVQAENDRGEFEGFSGPLGQKMMIELTAKELNSKYNLVQELSKDPLNAVQEKALNSIYSGIQVHDHDSVAKVARSFKDQHEFAKVVDHLNGNFDLNNDNKSVRFHSGFAPGVGLFQYEDEYEQLIKIKVGTPRD